MELRVILLVGINYDLVQSYNLQTMKGKDRPVFQENSDLFK